MADAVERRHRFSLVTEDEVGDLFRCSCGVQDWDYAQGADAYARHLVTVRANLAAALSPRSAVAGDREDDVDLAALLHDNGFTWDDANAVNAILTHHELVVLRAATPSPTPPEGLRAALVLAHSMLHSGEQPTRQSEDIMHAALLAAPAPDPGAVPENVLATFGKLLCDGRQHEHAWSVCYDSNRLAEYALARGPWDRKGYWRTPEMDRLSAPSAEPPETETA